MKKTIKQRNLELLQANGWREDTTTRVSRYMVLSHPDASYHYYLGKSGAVRRGKTVTSSVSVKLKMPITDKPDYKGDAREVALKHARIPGTSMNIGDYKLDVNTDDRGRIVAELWHKASGKTLGIEEVDSVDHAKHWADGVLRLIGDDARNRTPDAELDASERDDQPEEVERNRPVRCAIRNRNGTTTPVMGTPTLDGSLIDDQGFRHEPGTWFASKPSQGEESEGQG